MRSYGIISGKKIDSKIWLVDGAVEKPAPEKAPSNIGITGAYALTPEVFDYIKKLRKGKGGEYQLTDAIREMCKDMEVYGYEFEGKRYDIGTKELWIKTFIEFAYKDSRFKLK